MTYKTKISKWRANYFRNVKHLWQNITIHGIPRIVVVNSWLEILFWITIFLSGLFYFVILLRNSLRSYNNKPLIKTIDTVVYPTSLLPFPAVTVCNFNIVYKPKSDEIVELLIKHGIEESLARRFFFKLALLHEPRMFDPRPYRKVYKVLSKIGYSSNTRLMQDIAQPCSSLLNYCSWAGHEMNCSLLFTQSKAEMGFCCSFNSRLYPLHANESQQYFTTAGPTRGLHVEFNIPTDQYVPIGSYDAGLIVYVHEFDTYADETSFFALIEPGKEVTMQMVPSVFETTHDIINVKQNIRKCWFNEEGPNVFQVNYTFKNCMHMCKTITIGNLCKCVPYTHPDYVKWNSCSLMHVPCLVKNEDSYIHLDTVLNNKGTVKNQQTVCNCMPPCTGINYDGNLHYLFYKKPNGDTRLDKSGVRVFFQNNWCTKYSVQKSMHTDELVALVGGLFALCLGGSILSFVEFVVFSMKCFFGMNFPEEKQAVFQLYWDELKYNKTKIPRNRQKVRYPVHWDSLIN